MYPGAQVFWAKWSPPHERSRLVAFAFGGKCFEIEVNINQVFRGVFRLCKNMYIHVMFVYNVDKGSQLGNALAFPISSLLCDSVGWAVIFYLLGKIGFLFKRYL